MATATSLLAQIDAAIENLLAALADTAVQQYTIAGRTVQRADFAGTLHTLLKQRETLAQQASRETSGAIRLARFGTPRGVDR